MGNTKRRVFSGILALALCLSCLTLPAFAQSHEPKDEVIIYTGDPNAKPPATPQETKPAPTNPPSTTPTAPPAATPPATEPEPTAANPGEPFSEGSDIVTRDMLYDKATNKQFITIQDRDGNYSTDVTPEIPEPEKVEVVAETFRDRLAPGSVETWRFRLVKGKTTLTDAAMVATMYNEALEALQSSNWPGVFSWWTHRGYINMQSPYIRTLDRMIGVPFNTAKSGVLEWPQFMFEATRLIYIRGAQNGMFARKQALVGSANPAVAEDMYEMSEAASPMMSAGAADMEKAEEESVAADAGTSEAPQEQYREAEVLQALWMPNLV